MTSKTYDCKSCRVKIQFQAYDVDIDLVQAQLAIDKFTQEAAEKNLRDAHAMDYICEHLRQWFVKPSGESPLLPEMGEALQAYWAVTEEFAKLKKKFYETHALIELSGSSPTETEKPTNRFLAWLKRIKSYGNGSPVPH